MNQTAKNLSVDHIAILSITIDDEKIIADLSDGRVVAIPVAWFPRLVSASLEDLRNFEISPSGYGVHWPNLDEDISIKSFIG